MRDMSDPGCPEGFECFLQMQTHFREAMGVRAKRNTLPAHFCKLFQDERVGHDDPGRFAQPGNIDVQRQAAFDTGFQCGADFFFITNRLVT